MTTASVSVEGDIPIPPKRGGYYKYKWDAMKVGDSFLVTVDINIISSVANRAAKRLGYKFTCRTTEEGVRVWRIA
jgi:hypothetical protein